MNTTKEICNELIQIANGRLEEIEKMLPTNSIECFVILTETIRVLDLYSFSSDSNSQEEASRIQHLDVMKMGWNLAASYLFKPIHEKGFPILKSTTESRLNAAGLLFNLGCTTLIKRTVEMIKAGILSVERKGSLFTFKNTSIANSQFLDYMELSYLTELEERISNSANELGGWNLVKEDDIKEVLNKPGNFFSKISKGKWTDSILSNIDDLMIPLMSPWDSGHGIMLSYNTTPEIDFHFLAKAMDLVIPWRDEAGIHPGQSLEK